MTELLWQGTGHARSVVSATGQPVGEVKVRSTPQGPRWYATCEPGHECTPDEGRLRFGQAAQDLLDALKELA